MNTLLNRATLVASAALLPAIALGQMVSPTMSDATIVARGSLRLRSQVEWTRYGAIFGPDGKRTLPLGSALSTDLDAVAFPALGQAELAVQAMTGTPSVQLNIGTLRTTADSRIASVPVSLEYGLTSRITLGVMVPIVQTRTVITTQLNGRADSSANVGVNPAGFLFSQAAWTANSQVTSGLTSAISALTTKLQQCALAPSDPSCASINGRQAEANALLADAGTFKSAAQDLYGVSPSLRGAPFIPLAGSTIQQSIDTHLSSIRASFTTFGISPGSGAFAAAQGFGANDQLQVLVNDPRYGIGLDSIGTTEQIALGDIELAVTTQLFNSFTDSATGGIKWRGAFAAVVRLGTGHRARQNRPLDIGTGDGQTDVEVRGAVDMLFRDRLLTTIAGTYTQQLGTLDYDRLPSSPDFIFSFDVPVAGSIKPGNMAALRVNPRYLVTRGLMVGGLFAGTHRGADQTTVTGDIVPSSLFGNTRPVNTWAGGLTISYSNLATHAGTGDARFPAEIRFSHLETVGATAIGAEKASRDAIELRLYFRTRR